MRTLLSNKKFALRYCNNWGYMKMNHKKGHYFWIMVDITKYQVRLSMSVSWIKIFDFYWNAPMFTRYLSLQLLGPELSLWLHREE